MSHTDSLDALAGGLAREIAKKRDQQLSDCITARLGHMPEIEDLKGRLVQQETENPEVKVLLLDGKPLCKYTTVLIDESHFKDKMTCVTARWSFQPL